MSNIEEFGKYCLLKLNEGDEQINEEEADEEQENYVEEEIKEKEKSEQKLDKSERDDKSFLKRGKRKISISKKKRTSKKKYDTFSNDMKRKVINAVI